ncbi:MAG TPA: hypothetical protein VGH70_13930 [Bradyrhizobium sp.]|jgi:hypothetical protein
MAAFSVQDGPTATRSFWLGIAAYLVPSFPIAYAWHLVWLAPSYADDASSLALKIE